jgi:hypothetical protein
METGKNSLRSYEVGQTKLEELQSSYSLLIESEIDQLSLAILDKKANQCVGLSTFNIDRVNKRDQLKKILEEDSILNYPFSNRMILVASRECVFIPEEVYEESKNDLYITTSFGNNFEGRCFAKRVPELSNFLVFKVPYWLLEQFDHSLSGATLSHSTLYLAESIYRMSVQKNGLAIHAHFKRSFFELFIFDKGKMLFYNSFSYETSEDIAYFIMYALKQWEIDGNEISVSGVLDESSDELYWLRKYLNEIYIYPLDLLLFYPPAIEFPAAYINLLNPSLCE